MLILDNVTPNGKGHTIEFSFIKNVEINGTIINSDSATISADISISDSKGNIVAETQTDDRGQYDIKVSMKENQNYTLTAIAENSFVQTTILNTSKLKKDSVFRDIRLVLPLLKSGQKYQLGNINFFSNQAYLLPASLPSVQSLFKMMKKNKKMVIEIQGHTNGGDWRLPKNRQSAFEKELSEERAKTIYNYLITHGIEKERMTTVGFGSTIPLYKDADSDFKSQANMRVEIKVISIE